jgi:hypothetical protein
MSINKAILAAGASLSLLTAAPASAATLIIDSNGQLTGATGVDVLGVSYDVEFVKDTFSNVYADIAALQALPFVQAGSAGVVAAGQSLLDQVLIGAFDDRPQLTFGCDATSACSTIIGFNFDGTSAGYLVVTNFSSMFEFQQSDRVILGSTNVFASDLDSFPLNFAGNAARFSVSQATTPPINSAVPEPSTWAMMLLGFFGIGGAMRKLRLSQPRRCSMAG